MSGLSLFLPIAWRNLWRNPRRTFITLIIVALGMWSILSFNVFLTAWADSSRNETLRLLTGEGQIHAAGYLDDPNVGHRLPAPAGDLRKALDSPFVSAWTARVRVPAIVQSEYRMRPLTFLGVSPESERAMSYLPSRIVVGRYLRGPDDPGIVIGANLAERLKTRLGKRIVMMAQAADGSLAEASFEIVGLYEATKPVETEFVFTGLATSQALLGIGDEISEIAFDISEDKALEKVVSLLQRAAPDADVRSWMTLSPLAYTMETTAQSYVGIWLMIVFVLMAIGIVNTQLMAVFDRKHEFGLLQALGMRPRLVLLQVTLESALLIGLGVLVGVAAVMATFLPLQNGVDFSFVATAMETYGASEVLYPRLDPALMATFSLIVWVLGILAALWPAFSATNANPAAAMSAH